MKPVEGLGKDTDYVKHTRNSHLQRRGTNQKIRRNIKHKVKDEAIRYNRYKEG
jgi:hypothetical protein